MRAPPLTSLAISGLLLALSAASVSAQQSMQDFQLPPAPTPTATPQVEGPVDDSGIIPVGPRAVPTSASIEPAASPTPPPSPEQTQASRSQPDNAASRPIVQPTPSSSGRDAQPSAQRRAPQATPTSRSTPAISNQPAIDAEAPTTEQSGEASVDALPAPAGAPTSQTPLPPAAKTEPLDIRVSEGLPASWPWWLGGLALALLALFAGWVFRQRSAAPVQSAGLSQNPAAGAADDAALPAESAIVSKADLAVQLEVEQLSRSMMAITLKCRVTLSNRSDRAARDIALCADLVCANRQLPMNAQIANEASFLPEVGKTNRLGPHKTQSVAATLTIPIQQVAAFKHGNRPMFVPLVRVRMDCKDQEPIFRTFVVGIAADPTLQSSSKLHPVPLDGIPGSYQGVRSRPITNPTPSKP